MVLVASLMLTGVAFAFAAGYAEEHTRVQFVADSDKLETSVTERMAAYEQILLSGRGLFLASGSVTREEWRTFVEALELDRTYPGTQGVGYAVKLLPEELEAHVETVRAEGFPNYNVTPPGNRDVYTSIIYLEPFERRNLRAFGFDMFSDPVRRQAMELARDTGRPALTGRVVLVQEEQGTDLQMGFLLYVPHYRPGWPTDTVAERRDALLGYVYSPFRATDLMTAILRERDPHLEVELYDGHRPDPYSLLYSSRPDSPIPSTSEEFTRARTFTVGNREWTLVTHLTEPQTPYSVWVPRGVLLTGLVTSGLLFAVVYSLSTTRERSLRLAEEMTSELRRGRDELQASNDALQAFTFVVSHDLKEPVRAVEANLRILIEDFGPTLDAEARLLTERAHGATLRMSALLVNLLELSRVNRADLSMKRRRIEDIVASPDCRLAYERLQEERGAMVLVDCPTPVLVAPSVLAQALGNLIANALSHGGENVRTVRIREAARHHERIEVVVEDDGAGFPDGFVERFNAGGLDLGTTGFGLLIARRAVERLGGTLWLGQSDTLGGGAVHLTLREASPDRDE